ncbi:MAG: UbiD family decarboxylase [Phycisphaerales bacterium]|nr:UbiD family decarboxylase [Phycisphaerales bacterium]
MTFKCLQSFLAHLDSIGELKRISDPVSPLLEITGFTQEEAVKHSPTLSSDATTYDSGREGVGGQALLFEHVEGCDFPLAINVFGSYFRMEQALGQRGFSDIADEIGELAKPVPPSGIREMLSMAKKFSPLIKLKPKRKSGRGLCQQNIKRTSNGEVDLTRLPLIKCWPLDGDPEAVGYNITKEESGTANGDGRYITFAGMHTIHADDRFNEKPPSHNIGMYRAQLIDDTHLAMHWHIHHDGAAHWRSWKEIGEPMPIAICFGGETVLPYAATSPLPPGISELLMAGYLQKKGIELVKGVTVPLWVPANSEFVIEGFVSTECGNIGWEPGDEPLGEGAVFEGPFGDHTGYYSMPDRYPVVDVTAVTHRNNAVFPATVVGPPPQEDYYLGKATERIMLPLLKVIVPDIIDYHLPRFGAFHNCAFIKIKPEYTEHARKVMHAVWGAGQMAWTKLIVVVGEDVDVHDEHAVLQQVSGIDIKNDIELTRGPLDILDHAASELGAGGKMGIDATHAAPNKDGIAIIGVNKTKGGQGGEAIQKHSSKANIVIAVDDSIDCNDMSEVFFHFCASFDPSRDVHHCDGFIGFDGTSKMKGDERNGRAVRPWPPFLRIDARE